MWLVVIRGTDCSQGVWIPQPTTESLGHGKFNPLSALYGQEKRSISFINPKLLIFVHS